MKKNRLGERLAEFVGEVFEMPSVSLPSGYVITVTDGRETQLTGCRAITSYSDEYVEIELFSGKLGIHGKELDIARYNDTEITLRGRIEKIILSENDK